MTRSERLYQAALTRRELDEYLGRFRFELDAESCPRHLEYVGTVCRLLIERWVGLTGESLETRGYRAQIHEYARQAAEMWAPLKPPKSERPSLRVIEGGS